MGKFIVTLSIEVEVEAPTPDDAYDRFFEQAKWELGVDLDAHDWLCSMERKEEDR